MGSCELTISKCSRSKFAPDSVKQLMEIRLLRRAVKMPTPSIVTTLMLVMISVEISWSKSNSDYCSFSSKHTMCRYKGVSPECAHQSVRGISESEKREILDYHNRLRSRVASGQISQPPASDMMELSWDQELAAVAQAHADQCKFRHDCADCRRVDRFKVGQNLYQSYNTRQVGPNWIKAIDSWFNEINQFPSSSVKSFQFNHKTGHYSQMVWGSTTRIGCGSILYRSKKFNVRLYTCNYGEAGNILRRKMYNVGKSCSHCPCGTSCSDDYPGLCSSHARNSTNHNLMCMLNMPHMMHMTMDMAHDIGEGMMDTVHVTGDMAMHTANDVGHLAMDTVHTVGHAAMDTVHGVGDLTFNTVNTVNNFVNDGFSPVSNLVNTGFNFAFSPFLSSGNGNHNNRFRPGRK